MTTQTPKKALDKPSIDLVTMARKLRIRPASNLNGLGLQRGYAIDRDIVTKVRMLPAFWVLITLILFLLVPDSGHVLIVASFCITLCIILLAAFILISLQVYKNRQWYVPKHDLRMRALYAALAASERPKEDKLAVTMFMHNKCHKLSGNVFDIRQTRTNIRAELDTYFSTALRLQIAKVSLRDLAATTVRSLFGCYDVYLNSTAIEKEYQSKRREYNETRTRGRRKLAMSQKTELATYDASTASQGAELTRNKNRAQAAIVVEDSDLR